MYQVAQASLSKISRAVLDLKGPSDLLIVIILPPILYLLLKPELYGLTPNALDPVFYTGYAINFSDLILASGANHYFVARWTAYGPTSVLQLLIGLDAARLVVRWIWVSTIALAILKMAPIQRKDAKIFAVVVIISMPIFVRAMFTDYTESTYVPALLLLAILAAWGKVSKGGASLLGILAAVAVIANLFALVHVLTIGTLYAVRLLDRPKF